MRVALFLLATAAMAEYATVDGHKVYYEVAGRGEPAIVMVHSWALDGTFWDAQRNALGAKHKLLILDLPGHGRSDKPRVNYDAALFSKGVRAAMDAAGVKRAVLMGHGLGSVVIRRVYKDVPQRVLALVSVDGSLTPLTEEELASMNALTELMEGALGQEVLREAITKMLGATPPALAQRISSAMLASPEFVAVSVVRNFFRDAVWDGSGRVLVPALVVNQAEMGTETRQLYDKVFADLDYRTLDGVSQFLHMEAPDRFNPIVLEFLARLKR